MGRARRRAAFEFGWSQNSKNDSVLLGDVVKSVSQKYSMFYILLIMGDDEKPLCHIATQSAVCYSVRHRAHESLMLGNVQPLAFISFYAQQMTHESKK